MAVTSSAVPSSDHNERPASPRSRPLKLIPGGQTNTGEVVAPTQVTVSLLRRLDWRQFEVFCAALWTNSDERVVLSPIGPDTGIDIRLLHRGQTADIVQCKHRSTSTNISPAELRAFAFVVLREKVARGWLMTTGRVSPVMRVELAQHVEFMTGPELVKQFNRLPHSAQQQVVDETFVADWATPTCVSCTRKKVDLGTGWRCRDQPCNGTRSLFIS